MRIHFETRAEKTARHKVSREVKRLAIEKSHNEIKERTVCSDKDKDIVFVGKKLCGSYKHGYWTHYRCCVYTTQTEGQYVAYYFNGDYRKAAICSADELVEFFEYRSEAKEMLRKHGFKVDIDICKETENE